MSYRHRLAMRMDIFLSPQASYKEAFFQYHVLIELHLYNVITMSIFRVQ